MSKFWNLFYGTIIGGYYFEFLLWLDKRKSKVKYLTPKEQVQAIREYSLIGEGTTLAKRRLSKLAKTKEEYDSILKETNILEFAKGENTTSKGQYASAIMNSSENKRLQDIITDTDKAKMIDKRIDDMYELQEYTVKRNLIKDIRRAANEKNLDLLNKLQEEFKSKYGRTTNRRS